MNLTAETYLGEISVVIISTVEVIFIFANITNTFANITINQFTKILRGHQVLWWSASPNSFFGIFRMYPDHFYHFLGSLDSKKPHEMQMCKLHPSLFISTLWLLQKMFFTVSLAWQQDTRQQPQIQSDGSSSEQMSRINTAVAELYGGRHKNSSQTLK